MKKTIIRLIALTVASLMICAIFAGCGKKDDPKKTSENTETVTEAPGDTGTGTETEINDPEESDSTLYVIKSEHYGVSNAMLSFFLREAFMNTYQSYLSYFGSELMAYLGLSADMPLKDQPFTMGEAEEGVETWYDYFLKMAVEQAEQCLLYREAADKEGITLDDEDLQTIDGIISNISSAAAESDTPFEEYLENLLGKDVTEEVLRNCLELESYASKYVEKVINEADVSEDAVVAIYENDPLSYDVVSYMSYTFRTTDVMEKEEPEDAEAETGEVETEAPAEEDPAAKEEAMAKIKTYADELAAVKDAEEFHDYVYNYSVDVAGADESTAEMIANYSLIEDAGYSEEQEASKWAFEAKKGDTKILTDEEAGTVTVFLLVKERSKNESLPEARAVRHILFGKDDFDDAEAKSKEVYDKWVKDGAKLEDFLSLVTEYSTDPGSKDNGGLYENVQKGKMVAEFEDWMFDENRKTGDYGLIETQFGWHIMYMESEPQWISMIKSEIKSKAYDDNLERLHEEYEITVSEDDFMVADIAEAGEENEETSPNVTDEIPESEVPSTEPAAETGN